MKSPEDNSSESQIAMKKTHSSSCFAAGSRQKTHGIPTQRLHLAGGQKFLEELDRMVGLRARDLNSLDGATLAYHPFPTTAATAA